MGFKINTNIAALNAHNNSVMNNRNLDLSLAKLSSGLRINKAADDASGLAIANSLRSQASSLGQAISNGNDAIGLLQTADGALNEYSNILDTIKTKSIQAASDGQNTSSRLAIQNDIDKLMEQLNTIANTTSFNGQKLLSGTFVNKEFQMGASANESAKVNIASAVTSQIGQTSRATLTIASQGENQLTLRSATTGSTVMLESINIQANNNPANGMGAIADQMNRHTGTTGISAVAIVKSTTESITTGVTGVDFSINGANIGAINVLTNDADGTLLTAINNKTSQTGVAATKTTDGRLTLTSVDGRAISVTGDLSSVTASTGSDLSTLGHIEVTQAGSSTFQIDGAKLGTAVGADMTITGTTTMVQDSTLALGSTIVTGSKLEAGTVFGVDLSAGDTDAAAASSTQDGLLVAGSIIGSGSTLDDGTLLASKIETRATATLSGDMLVKVGSTLASATVLDAGTVLQQDLTVSGTDYKAGTTLVVDLTLTASMTLSKDMTLTVDLQNPHAAIGAGSKLLAGTILGADIVTTGTSTLGGSMVLQAGSTLLTGSVFKAGSHLGENFTLNNDKVTTAATDLKVGSTLVSGSIVKENSTLGGEATLRSNLVLNQDMVIKAGSTLVTGTILKEGTVLQQDLTDAQVGGGTGSGLRAGTVLGTDVTTTASIFVNKDMVMLQGDATYGTIAAGSVLAANGGDHNSVQLDNEAFTNLSNIDVTTLRGAMEAISTLEAAIGNLDTIRSGLGSVQNQITSTINNISVTQVNVKAAESNIRDVDFAAESANFSKFNILAQSGSYAMSQANAVQQNVLRLLQ